MKGNDGVTVATTTTMASMKEQFEEWGSSDQALHRERILAIMPHVTGTLSMLGSIMTLYKIWEHSRMQRSTAVTESTRSMTTKPSSINSKFKLYSYHYIMIVMSICDFVTSASYALSTWLVPYDQIQYTLLRPNRYGAMGTAATCSAQGFFIQFGLTVIFCNLLLTLHYTAVIRYRYTERQIRTFVRPSIIGVLICGLIVSVPFLFVDGYNFMHCLPSWCWLAPNPETCAMDGSAGMQACQAQANLWRNVAYFAPMWICVSFVVIGQVLIVLTVREAQQRANKWNTTMWKSSNVTSTTTNSSSTRSCSGTKNDKRQQLQQHGGESQMIRRAREKELKRLRRKADSYQQIGMQSFWYIASFFICWLPMTIATNLLHDRRKWFLTNNWYYLVLAAVTLQPLQGFLNFIVYNHRCIKKRINHLMKNCCARYTKQDAFTPCENPLDQANRKMEMQSHQEDLDVMCESVAPPIEEGGNEEQINKKDTIVAAGEKRTSCNGMGVGHSRRSSYNRGSTFQTMYMSDDEEWRGDHQGNEGDEWNTDTAGSSIDESNLAEIEDMYAP